MVVLWRSCLSPVKRMKWKLFKLFFPIILIGFVAPMITPGPDGQPLMTWRDWVPDKSSLVKLLSFLEGAVEVIDPEGSLSSSVDFIGEKKIYQWQDEQGHWYFTDNFESAAAHAISKPLPEVKNFMVPLSLPETEVEAGLGLQEGFNFSPTTVPIEKFPQLIEDARNIQKLSDKRARQLDEI
jgi:hypothetical protein